MSESRSTIWRRRAVTIPAMLTATAVAVAGLPLLAPLAALTDLTRGRWRLPTLRVYLFVLQYLINDSVEIVLAPALWLTGGFGLRVGAARSIARHERLMQWSADLLARRADQLLGLRLEVDPRVEEVISPGPVVVIARHVSPFDASLPGLVCHRAGLSVRGVIMAELLADPGFDLLYRRLGSVFIARDDAVAAVAAIDAMARARPVDEASALVIFPEGRLFTPELRDRSLDRLAERDPERRERLRELTNVLPPRSAGFVTLLAAVPDADVVVLDHDGLDGIQTLADLVGHTPASEPVRVTARRVARSELPTGDADLAAWLDGTWLALDDRSQRYGLSGEPQCDRRRSGGQRAGRRKGWNRLGAERGGFGWHCGCCTARPARGITRHAPTSSPAIDGRCWVCCCSGDLPSPAAARSARSGMPSAR